MTTIAANRKAMAGDTLVSGGGPVYHTNKIFRIRDSLVGVAGDVAYTTKWLEWFRREMPPVESLMDIGDDETFFALELNHRGLFLYLNTCEPDHLHDRCYAIGTGADVACAEMVLHKSTPRDAVRAAMQFDEGTGGRIQEMTLLPPRKEKQVRKAKPKVAEAAPVPETK